MKELKSVLEIYRKKACLQRDQILDLLLHLQAGVHLEESENSQVLKIGFSLMRKLNLHQKEDRTQSKVDMLQVTLGFLPPIVENLSFHQIHLLQYLRFLR